MMGVLNNVFLHLHPVRLPKHAVKVKYTWCMGGLSFFIFLVLTITGILLMFYYRPTVEAAYGDIIDIGSQVPLGIMREIHRWGAHLMVITVWLHMFRVFMTGSYKPPREFNWLIGVLLLTLTMFLSYTGYLLPWDQLAIWAVTVGANMAPRGTVSRPRGTRRLTAVDRRRELRARRCGRQVRPARRALSGRGHAAALLRAALHRGAVHRDDPDDRPLLAHPEGWRHLGTHVSGMD